MLLLLHISLVLVEETSATIFMLTFSQILNMAKKYAKSSKLWSGNIRHHDIPRSIRCWRRPRTCHKGHCVAQASKGWVTSGPPVKSSCRTLALPLCLQHGHRQGQNPKQRPPPPKESCNASHRHGKKITVLWLCLL